MGHFHCGVERVNSFVNVHLHCNVSNLKKISKMSTLRPQEKFLRTPMVSTISFYFMSSIIKLVKTNFSGKCQTG